MKLVQALSCMFVGLAVSLTSADAALQFQAEATPDGLRFVLVTGDFDYGDDLAVFGSLAATSQATAVTFNSPGGNVIKAMELGRLVRRLGLNTIQLRALECESACALAFLGGVVRYAEPGSIGVHRSSFSPGTALTPEDATAAVQQMTAQVIAYLSEMGVDPALLEVALSYDSTDMRYLSGSEMARYKVTTDIAPPASPPDDATASYAPPTPDALPATPGEAGKAGLEHDVLDFVRAVITAHGRSQPEALPTLLSSYADYVQYYGKRTPWLDVLHDKENYFRRWPRRIYRIRDETVSVTCRVFACEVSGEYDWAVQSPARRKKASGTASFHFVVEISHGLRIVDESSRILARQ
jgi:hypothetical protein